MARIQISENNLKEIIRECVEKVINEDYTDFKGSYYDQNMQQSPAYKPENQPTGPGPSLTRGQVDANNAAVNNALNNWNKLGVVGQIREIQKLVGAEPDGKIGPQTLGKIYVKLTKNSDLAQVNFRSGRRGTYTNR